MTATVTQPLAVLSLAPRARLRVTRSRRPWVHPGVASERAQRAEAAYVGQLTHAEHAARVRAERRPER